MLLRDSISSVFAASSLSFIVVLVRNSQLATKTYIEADNFLVSPLRLLEYQALEQELKNDESFYIKEG